jgi:hypothetical protein
MTSFVRKPWIYAAQSRTRGQNSATPPILPLACVLRRSADLRGRFDGPRRIPVPQALVAFRAFQAVGGSMLNPVAMSIISTT